MRLSDYSQSGGRGLFRRDRRIYDQRGTFTFTIPDGVTKVWAFAIGAGGGGRILASSSGNWSNEGMVGGGKGGGYASGIISGLTPGNTLTLTVPAGGIGAYKSTAAAAGGDTTVAGGGTTYLTGGGGGAADAPVTSDPGNKKGQGGTASTNSVTDAYTAAGGGSFAWTAGVGQGSITANNLDTVCGGGASGSPFGTGMAHTKSVGLRRGATGGGGWCQREYTRSEWLGGSGESNGEILCSGGCGSHHPVHFFNGRNNLSMWNGYNGGRGRTAIGGETVFIADGAADIQQGSSQVDKFFQSGGYYYTDQKGGFQSRLDGEDGNPNWWFPWEIDGSGGGGAYVDRYAGQMWTGGQGGPGAGGGGVFGSFSNTGQAQGGRGGFGGGGGGAYSSLGNISHLGTAWGGEGGNGGGGGSAFGRYDTDRYMPIGGNGGDGAIGIYW